MKAGSIEARPFYALHRYDGPEGVELYTPGRRRVFCRSETNPARSAFVGGNVPPTLGRGYMGRDLAAALLRKWRKAGHKIKRTFII